MKPGATSRSWPLMDSRRGRHSFPFVIAGAIAMLVFVGCGDDDLEKSTPIPRGQPTSAINQGSINAKVADVLDGITIEVEIANEFLRVRYLGVDIPTGGNGDLAGSASSYNRFLVENETVELERGVVNQDADGNYLRYVYVNGEMVNLTMISSGHAVVADFPSEFKYLSSYVDAMREAERDERGVWSSGSLAINRNPLENLTRFQGGTLPVLDDWRGPQVECDFTDSEVPVIKGKIDQKSGDKYYLIPGSTAYQRTFVIESVGDRWFCTEVDARAEGFKQSRG